MSKTINSRNIILDILIEINEKGQYSHIVLRNALKKYQYLQEEDRSFISKVVLGSVERLITLDYYIDSVSKIKTKKMKPVIRNILRMSTYQIMFMDKTGDFAACNEAVKLAAERGFTTLKGFINGVLRTICREKQNFKLPDEQENNLKFLSVKYSTPEWIISKWLVDYKYPLVEKMLEAQFTDRPLTIRCNLTKIKPDDLREKLEQHGIKVSMSPYLPESMEISEYDYLDKIPEFREGLFFVQDISSMMVCHVADPKPNSYVIDVCAAPGGKSMHMAEMLNDSGYVEARDLSETKVELIRENIERLGFENVAAIAMDARNVDELSIEKADIVIADLPCSGLGIINKKPDIKYHASIEKCEELVSLQREILDACSKYVKPGGTLIYSTCTVNRDENIENAKWFEKNHPFTMTGFSNLIPEQLRYEATDKGYIELLPGVAVNDVKDNVNYDGFFIAKFTRN